MTKHVLLYCIKVQIPHFYFRFWEIFCHLYVVYVWIFLEQHLIRWKAFTCCSDKERRVLETWHRFNRVMFLRIFPSVCHHWCAFRNLNIVNLGFWDLWVLFESSTACEMWWDSFPPLDSAAVSPACSRCRIWNEQTSVVLEIFGNTFKKDSFIKNSWNYIPEYSLRPFLFLL